MVNDRHNSTTSFSEQPVRRYEKKSLREEMFPRDRVMAALNRKIPDKVPKELKFTPPLLELFKEKTGSDDPVKYFNIELREVKVDDVGYASWHRGKTNHRRQMFERYFAEKLPEGSVIDEWWGIGYLPGSMYHFVRLEHPLKTFESVEELEGYPFPKKELIDSQIDRLREEVAHIKEENLAVVGFMEMTIFEVAWYLRGMENLFLDFARNRDFAVFLLDKITDIRGQMVRLLADIGVDVIKLGDDIGTQKGLLMSPDTWREWLKPRLAKVIQVAKDRKPDIPICYHSDGNIEPVIPELIEIGINVLNPVQPECMDPVKIKERYGHKLSFWGTIGTQTTMPFGSPEDVRQAVKESINKIGQGGGLVIAPTHVLQPEVPWENILAFVEAVEEYGRT